MKFIFLLMLISFSAFADVKSEEKDIQNFDEKEFRNKSNYAPAKPGQLPNITDDFRKKLTNDPKSLKYFVFLKSIYRLADKSKNDKALRIVLESKFGGKKLTSAEWSKIANFMGNSIFNESKDEHLKSIANKEAADAHYEKHFQKVLKATSF